MSWPTPNPGDISSRAASVYEALLPGVDARNPNTVATANTRITEMAMQDLYYFQGDVAQEMFPDTAVANLQRIANMWGVPRVQPSAASGNVVIAGTPNAPIATGLTFSYPGSTIVYTSTSAVTIGAGGTVSVPVTADSTGAASNLAAGSILTLTSPVANIAPLTGTVDANGLTGGADIQSIAAWRTAIIAQIQYQPSGGDYQDYVKWAYAALPNVALATCPVAACGGGVVSVVIAMTDAVTGLLRAPTTGELATVQAYINNRRPVVAVPTVYAVVLNPINITLHVSPNTPTIQAAAQAALQLFFAQDAQVGGIGGTTYLSRLNDAISNADGEFYHELSLPAADVPAPTLFSLNVLGSESFV
ncbi:MAG: hypothetical protein B7Z80_25780 [Rhodospirillales bacterium 20-64-7]|nr:MAG: hypothetical protein B7Z80_25780 [Rhodospirillales bacterium 20-64-7]